MVVRTEPASGRRATISLRRTTAQFDSFSNVFSQYWDDGLFISQFGQNNVSPSNQAGAAGFSSNNTAADMIMGPDGNLYVFNTDEAQHSGLHVWKVTGLDTIHEISASGTLGSTITLIDSSGPVANWHDDQGGGTSLTDGTGNANTGTLNGTSVYFQNTTDVFNTNTPLSDSMGFASNNSTSYVSVPNTANLNFSGGITVSAWVKATADTGTKDLLTHGSISSGTEVYLRINAGNYEVGTYSGGVYHGVSVAAPAQDAGKYVQLTGIYDGTNWNLYDDGRLLGSSASTTGSVTVNSSWYIGGNPNDAGWYYTGSNIDEEAIYNRALTATEVAALANVGNYERRDKRAELRHACRRQL